MKAEIGEFAKKTLKIAENHEPEVLLIEPVVTHLKALMPEVELLSLRYGVDPQRVKVDAVRSKLMLKSSALKLKVRLTEKSSEDDELELVKNTVDVYLRHLSKSRNDKVLSDKVSGFVTAIDKNDALAKALSDLNLMNEVDALKMTFLEFDLALAQRVSLLSERPAIDTKVVVNKIISSVENLFKTIEVGSLLNPELDYEPLASELSQLVKTFRLSVTIRLASNRRNAEKKKEQESDEGIDNSNAANADATAMATAMHFGNDWDDEEPAITPFKLLSNPVGEAPAEALNSNADEGDGGSDQKKAVARLGNQTQQPFENDNA